MPKKEDYKLAELVIRKELASLEDVNDWLSAHLKAEQMGSKATFVDCLVRRGGLDKAVLDELMATLVPAPQLPSRDFGGFEVLEKLEQGPWGNEYHARDSEGDCEVRLRVLSPRLSENQDYLQRLLNSLNAAKSIKNDAFSKMYGVGEINGRTFVSLEWIEQPSVQDFVKSNGVLTVEAASQAVVGLADALASVEPGNRLKLDLQPANLVLEQGRKLKILYFGWVNADLNHPFASMEELAGKECNAASWVYSLGACLFFLLTGHSPFDEETVKAVKEGRLDPTPPSPSALDESIPQELSDYILQMMSAQPENRPASLADVAQRLSEFGGTERKSPTVKKSLGKHSVSLADDPNIAFAPTKQVVSKPPKKRDDKTKKFTDRRPPPNDPDAPSSKAETRAQKAVSPMPDNAPLEDAETVVVSEETKKSLKKLVDANREREQAQTQELSDSDLTDASAPTARETSQGSSRSAHIVKSPKTGLRTTERSRAASPKTSRTQAVRRKKSAVPMILAACVLLAATVAVAIFMIKPDKQKQPAKLPVQKKQGWTKEEVEEARKQHLEEKTAKANEQAHKKALEAADKRVQALETLSETPHIELAAAYQKLLELTDDQKKRSEIEVKLKAIKEQLIQNTASAYEKLKSEADALYAQKKYRSAILKLESLPEELRVVSVMPDWQKTIRNYREGVNQEYLGARLKIAELTGEGMEKMSMMKKKLPTRAELAQVVELLQAVATFSEDAQANEAKKALAYVEKFLEEAKEEINAREKMLSDTRAKRSKELYREFISNMQASSVDCDFAPAIALCQARLNDPAAGLQKALYEKHQLFLQMARNVFDSAERNLPSLKDKQVVSFGRTGTVAKVEGGVLTVVGAAQFNITLKELEWEQMVNLGLKDIGPRTGEGYRQKAIFAYCQGSLSKAEKELGQAKSSGADPNQVAMVWDVLQSEIKTRKHESDAADLVALIPDLLKKDDWKKAREALMELKDHFSDTKAFISQEQNLLVQLDKMEQRYEREEGEVIIKAGNYRNDIGTEAYVNGFAIDRWEVSNRQYARFLDWRKQNPTKKIGHEEEPKGKDYRPEFWDDPKYNQPDLPVVGVDFFDAYAYANWLGRRLPTASEWEKACRGQDGRMFPWGEEWQPERVNANDSALMDGSNDGFAGLAPVKSLAQGASPYGCLHMAGNVREWTSEPLRMRNQRNQATMCGGSYKGSRSQCQASSIGSFDVTERFDYVGFRTARDL
ncbi:MAG: SUMF1/EgtB/PvdO family nonheme iron enzyme [Planctomycetota bacterium]|nr:SUMF1/EgtB/PvdO family nonheme iron enzyme [Planctomycetota bacterium]